MESDAYKIATQGSKLTMLKEVVDSFMPGHIRRQHSSREELREQIENLLNSDAALRVPGNRGLV
jgi:hypothetical protein